MKVRELIAELLKMDQEANVVTEHEDADSGCSTCGYGATSSTRDVVVVTNLETRVVLNTSY